MPPTRTRPARPPYQCGDHVKALVSDEAGGTVLVPRAEVIKVTALTDGTTWRIAFHRPAAPGREWQGGIVEVVVYRDGQDANRYITRADEQE